MRCASLKVFYLTKNVIINYMNDQELPKLLETIKTNAHVKVMLNKDVDGFKNGDIGFIDLSPISEEQTEVADTNRPQWL